MSRQTQNSSDLDFKHALRITHYVIGTGHLCLVVGSSTGIRLIATVDTSYVTHDDVKSHSMWTVHMGSAVISRSKKQSIMTDSSTVSELVVAHSQRCFLGNSIFARTTFPDEQPCRYLH